MANKGGLEGQGFGDFHESNSAREVMSGVLKNVLLYGLAVAGGLGVIVLLSQFGR